MGTNSTEIIILKLGNNKIKNEFLQKDSITKYNFQTNMLKGNESFIQTLYVEEAVNVPFNNNPDVKRTMYFNDLICRFSYSLPMLKFVLSLFSESFDFIYLKCKHSYSSIYTLEGYIIFPNESMLKGQLNIARKKCLMTNAHFYSFENKSKL